MSVVFAWRERVLVTVANGEGVLRVEDSSGWLELLPLLDLPPTLLLRTLLRVTVSHPPSSSLLTGLFFPSQIGGCGLGGVAELVTLPLTPFTLSAHVGGVV